MQWEIIINKANKRTATTTLPDKTESQPKSPHVEDSEEITKRNDTGINKSVLPDETPASNLTLSDATLDEPNNLLPEETPASNLALPDVTSDKPDNVLPEETNTSVT